MFRITVTGPKTPFTVESVLDTVEAATRRVRMLRKHHPENEYRVEQKLPKVTVTRIAPNDPTANHIVRSAA